VPSFFLPAEYRPVPETNARTSKGTTIKHLYPATFANYKVAVPPPAEQLAIAEALRDTDALLDGLNRLIAKKRDLKQAAMQQLLTGQTRLPGFHSDWTARPLGEIAVVTEGHAAPQSATWKSRPSLPI